MTIQVKIRSVYGQDKIYPVCGKAQTFARMLGQSTLTDRDIQNIKALGFSVECVQETVSL